MISSLMMKALDKDSSGAASLDEFKSVGKSLPSGSFDQSEDALSKAFSSLDADSNGSLTESEIAQGLAKFSSESAGALLGQQEAGGMPPPPPPGGGKGESMFETADADGSGSVSLEEFTAVGPEGADTEKVEELFSSIDTDGDGEISSDEDETFRAAQGPGGPGGAGGPPPSGPPPSGSESDDEEDTASTLLSSLSDLLEAQSAYAKSASGVSSYLDEAISSLFSAAA